MDITTTTESPEDGDNINVLSIGIVAGGGAVITILIIALIVCTCHKSKKNSRQNETETASTVILDRSAVNAVTPTQVRRTAATTPTQRRHIIGGDIEAGEVVYRVNLQDTEPSVDDSKVIVADASNVYAVVGPLTVKTQDESPSQNGTLQRDEILNERPTSEVVVVENVTYDTMTRRDNANVVTVQAPRTVMPEPEVNTTLPPSETLPNQQRAFGYETVDLDNGTIGGVPIQNATNSEQPKAPADNNVFVNDAYKSFGDETEHPVVTERNNDVSDSDQNIDVFHNDAYQSYRNMPGDNGGPEVTRGSTVTGSDDTQNPNPIQEDNVFINDAYSRFGTGS